MVGPMELARGYFFATHPHQWVGSEAVNSAVSVVYPPLCAVSLAHWSAFIIVPR